VSSQWSQSGSNVYVIGSNVGIGTNNPQELLDVNGTIKATSFVASSNVGIGLTNPTSKLHVVGDTRIEGNLTVNGTQTIVNTNVGTTEQLIITNDGTGPALVVNQTGSQPVLDVQDDGVSVLKIIDGGNVGIGTTNPQAKLHVQGNGARFQSPNGNTINDIDIYSSADSVTRSYSGLKIWGNPVFSNGDNAVRNAARIYGGFINGGVNDWSNSFVTIAVAGATGNNGTLVDTLTVRKGSVGVGTTNPQAKLHVVGNIYVSSGNLRVSGTVNVVHRRPIYNPGSQNFTLSTTPQNILNIIYGPYAYAANQIPVAGGATRNFRIYGVYSDNITSGHNWYIRIENIDNTSNFTDYEMNSTYGGTTIESRDWYTSYNTSSFTNHGIIRTYVASGSSPANPVVSIKYLELQTLDVYN
jgi:hypothetical protein